MKAAGNTRHWRLHVGAHKTATTHLQDTLLACRADLADRGVHFLPRPALEKARFIKYVRFGAFSRHGLKERLLPRSEAAHMRARLLSGAKRRTVLISEEKILGRAVDLLDGFYPHLESNLQAVRAIIGDDPVTLYLSIRDQKDLLPSAYSQALRTHSRPEAFDVLADRWLEDPPRWPALIKRLEAAMPGADIKVWSMDQYADDSRQILNRLTGNSGLTVPDLERPERTARLNAAAIATLEELQPQGLEHADKRRVTAQAAQQDGAVFDPLDADARQRLTAVWEQDLAAIENRHWLV